MSFPTLPTSGTNGLPKGKFELSSLRFDTRLIYGTRLRVGWLRLCAQHEDHTMVRTQDGNLGFSEFEEMNQPLLGGFILLWQGSGWPRLCDNSVRR